MIIFPTIVSSCSLLSHFLGHCPSCLCNPQSMLHPAATMSFLPHRSEDDTFLIEALQQLPLTYIRDGKPFLYRPEGKYFKLCKPPYSASTALPQPCAMCKQIDGAVFQ